MLDRDLIPAQDRRSGKLMMALHGLGDSMEGYRWLPEALGLPELNYLLVNAPYPYYGGFSWYDFAGDPGPGIELSRKMLFEALEEQQAAGFPPEETWLFGFSQGCLMCLEIGARAPHRFAGIIGASGYVHQPEKLIAELAPAARSQRFLITHGTRDPLIPIAPVREQMAQLKAAGLNIEWHELEKEHGLAGEHEMTLIREFIKRNSERR